MQPCAYGCSELFDGRFDGSSYSRQQTKRDHTTIDEINVNVIRPLLVNFKLGAGEGTLTLASSLARTRSKQLSYTRMYRNIVAKLR